MHRQFFATLGTAILILTVPPCATAANGGPAATAAAAAALADFVDGASYRLSLADQVALTKWDSRKPVEDLPREKVVIDAAVGKGGAQGASVIRIAAVFADQIEANKLIQYRLLSQWERAAGAPSTARPNLVRDIRPKLDTLQTRLIADLLATSALPAEPDCSRQVAAAVGAYVNEKKLDALHALALDRAMARMCEQ